MAVGRYSLTLRSGPSVAHERFDDLDSGLRRLGDWVAEQSAGTRRETVNLGVRRFTPVQQVAARGELAGPRRLRGGIDVRGDGSCEAYTGRWRRRVVEAREGESLRAALERALPG